MFEERRRRVREAMGPRALMLLPAHPVYLRNGDVEHEYRADSDLLYLTGFAEPDAMAVLDGAPDAKHGFVLAVRPRDPEREVWDGPRAGIDGAKHTFGAEHSLTMGELDAYLAEAMVKHTRIYYALGRDRAMDDRVLAALAGARERTRRAGFAPTELVEPGVLLHELRWRKSEVELALMRRAAELTREGFDRVLRELAPGVMEYKIESWLRESYRALGSERVAYPPIVASGPNACILHYVQNNRRAGEGELVLIDSGTEWAGYACDVTRTLPVSGRFSGPQRAVYEVVLAAQKAAIDAVRTDRTLEQVHAAAVRVVTEGLVRLGALSGELDKLIDDKAYRPWFMHGTSHWLGLDVHDAGRYHDADGARKLEEGCVLTVEPGVYFSPGDERVPPELRGIGVRIEDDVVCTSGEATVLTWDIPREVADIERAMAQGRELQHAAQ